MFAARKSTTYPEKFAEIGFGKFILGVTVLVIDDIYSDDDSKEWADLTIGWLGYSPDAVFTSEDYGDRYAAFMGSTHVLVDKARLQVPCSGTAIRTNLSRNGNIWEPPVRAWFVKRICVLGAESTGTTTLAQALAREFKYLLGAGIWPGILRGENAAGRRSLDHGGIRPTSQRNKTA